MCHRRRQHLRRLWYGSDKAITSYPVYIDPYGAVFSTTLGAAPGGTIPLIAPQNIPAPYTGNASATRYFTLLDDMTFVTNGLPDTSSGVVPRGDRYTWALMLHQLTTSSVPSVSLTVVVYAGRSTAVQSGETTYAASGNFQDTSVTLTFPAGRRRPSDAARGFSTRVPMLPVCMGIFTALLP